MGGFITIVGYAFILTYSPLEPLPPLNAFIIKISFILNVLVYSFIKWNSKKL